MRQNLITKNSDILDIINKLYTKSKLTKKEIYKNLAKVLEGPSRKMPSLNLTKLENLNVIKDDAIVIIPGKLLGSGELKKKITIYAYQASSSVKEKFPKIKNFNDLLKDTIDYKKALIIK
ncbi:MAG: hypothetical protein V1824_00435 [archaeon]